MKFSATFLTFALLFASGVIAESRRTDGSLARRDTSDQDGAADKPHHKHHSKHKSKHCPVEQGSADGSTPPGSDYGDGSKGASGGGAAGGSGDGSKSNYGSGSGSRSGNGSGNGAGGRSGPRSGTGAGSGTNGGSGTGVGGGTGVAGGQSTPKGDAGSGAGSAADGGASGGSGTAGSTAVDLNAPKSGKSYDGRDYIVAVATESSGASLPSGYDFSQFSPNLLYTGKGTFYGKGENLDNTEGRCLYSDAPHSKIPSLCMNDVKWLDGLSCGACVEIWNTGLEAFTPNRQWKLWKPTEITSKPPGKTTLAFVSDWCPKNECGTGLDSHPDTWQKYTGMTQDSELKINWRFTSCKELFAEYETPDTKMLEVHWRKGTNPFWCSVQIRSSYQPVVKVEVQEKSGGQWQPTNHVDASFFDIKGCHPGAAYRFRLTSWQGNVIETEAGTYAPINTHMRINGANFD